MTLVFTAHVAGVDDDDDDGCLIAGVAERADGTGRSLIFQASRAPADDQDVRLGQDSYCLVTEVQGTAYGCVRELSIEGDTLRMLVRDDAIADLGLDDVWVEVRLAVHTPAIDALRAALIQILGYGRVDAHPTTLRL